MPHELSKSQFEFNTKLDILPSKSDEAALEFLTRCEFDVDMAKLLLTSALGSGRETHALYQLSNFYNSKGSKDSCPIDRSSLTNLDGSKTTRARLEDKSTSSPRVRSSRSLSTASGIMSGPAGDLNLGIEVCISPEWVDPVVSLQLATEPSHPHIYGNLFELMDWGIDPEEISIRIPLDLAPPALIHPTTGLPVPLPSEDFSASLEPDAKSVPTPLPIPAISDTQPILPLDTLSLNTETAKNTSITSFPNGFSEVAPAPTSMLNSCDQSSTGSFVFPSINESSLLSLSTASLPPVEPQVTASGSQQHQFPMNSDKVNDMSKVILTPPRPTPTEPQAEPSPFSVPFQSQSTGDEALVDVQNEKPSRSPEVYSTFLEPTILSLSQMSSTNTLDSTTKRVFSPETGLQLSSTMTLQRIPTFESTISDTKPTNTEEATKSGIDNAAEYVPTDVIEMEKMEEIKINKNLTPTSEEEGIESESSIEKNTSQADAPSTPSTPSSPSKITDTAVEKKAYRIRFLRSKRASVTNTGSGASTRAALDQSSQQSWRDWLADAEEVISSKSSPWDSLVKLRKEALTLPRLPRNGGNSQQSMLASQIAETCVVIGNRLRGAVRWRAMVRDELSAYAMTGTVRNLPTAQVLDKLLSASASLGVDLPESRILSNIITDAKEWLKCAEKMMKRITECVTEVTSCELLTIEEEARKISQSSKMHANPLYLPGVMDEDVIDGSDGTTSTPPLGAAQKSSKDNALDNSAIAISHRKQRRQFRRTDDAFLDDESSKLTTQSSYKRRTTTLPMAAIFASRNTALQAAEENSPPVPLSELIALIDEGSALPVYLNPLLRDLRIRLDMVQKLARKIAEHLPYYPTHDRTPAGTRIQQGYGLSEGIKGPGYIRGGESETFAGHPILLPMEPTSGTQSETQSPQYGMAIPSISTGNTGSMADGSVPYVSSSHLAFDALGSNPILLVANAKRSRIPLEHFESIAKEVRELGISFREGEMIKVYQNELLQWQKRVLDLVNHREKFTLNDIQYLLADADALPIDLSQGTALLRLELKKARSWLDTVRVMLPNKQQRTRSTEDGESNTPPSYAMLQALLHHADTGYVVSDPDTLTELRSNLRQANFWMAQVTPLLPITSPLSISGFQSNINDDGNSNEPSDVDFIVNLERLVAMADEIPIQLPEYELLVNELRTRLWSKRAQKVLAQPGYPTLEALRSLLEDSTLSTPDTGCGPGYTAGGIVPQRPPSEEETVRSLVKRGEEWYAFARKFGIQWGFSDQKGNQVVSGHGKNEVSFFIPSQSSLNKPILCNLKYLEDEARNIPIDFGRALGVQIDAIRKAEDWEADAKPILDQLHQAENYRSKLFESWQSFISDSKLKYETSRSQSGSTDATFADVFDLNAFQTLFNDVENKRIQGVVSPDEFLTIFARSIALPVLPTDDNLMRRVYQTILKSTRTFSQLLIVMGDFEKWRNTDDLSCNGIEHSITPAISHSNDAKLSALMLDIQRCATLPDGVLSQTLLKHALQCSSIELDDIAPPDDFVSLVRKSVQLCGIHATRKSSSRAQKKSIHTLDYNWSLPFGSYSILTEADNTMIAAKEEDESNVNFNSTPETTIRVTLPPLSFIRSLLLSMIGCPVDTGSALSTLYKLYSNASRFQKSCRNSLSQLGLQNMGFQFAAHGEDLLLLLAYGDQQMLHEEIDWYTKEYLASKLLLSKATMPSPFMILQPLIARSRAIRFPCKEYDVIEAIIPYLQWDFEANMIFSSMFQGETSRYRKEVVARSAFLSAASNQALLQHYLGKRVLDVDIPLLPPNEFLYLPEMDPSVAAEVSITDIHSCTWESFSMQLLSGQAAVIAGVFWYFQSVLSGATFMKAEGEGNIERLRQAMLDLQENHYLFHPIQTDVLQSVIESGKKLNIGTTTLVRDYPEPTVDEDTIEYNEKLYFPPESIQPQGSVQSIVPSVVTYSDVTDHSYPMQSSTTIAVTTSVQQTTSKSRKAKPRPRSKPAPKARSTTPVPTSRHRQAISASFDTTRSLEPLEGEDQENTSALGDVAHGFPGGTPAQIDGTLQDKIVTRRSRARIGRNLQAQQEKKEEGMEEDEAPIVSSVQTVSMEPSVGKKPTDDNLRPSPIADGDVDNHATDSAGSIPPTFVMEATEGYRKDNSQDQEIIVQGESESDHIPPASLEDAVGELAAPMHIVPSVIPGATLSFQVADELSHNMTKTSTALSTDDAPQSSGDTMDSRTSQLPKVTEASDTSTSVDSVVPTLDETIPNLIDTENMDTSAKVSLGAAEPATTEDKSTQDVELESEIANTKTSSPTHSSSNNKLPNESIEQVNATVATENALDAVMETSDTIMSEIENISGIEASSTAAETPFSPLISPEIHSIITHVPSGDATTEDSEQPVELSSSQGVEVPEEDLCIREPTEENLERRAAPMDDESVHTDADAEVETGNETTEEEADGVTETPTRSRRSSRRRIPSQWTQMQEEMVQETVTTILPRTKTQKSSRVRVRSTSLVSNTVATASAPAAKRRTARFAGISEPSVALTVDTISSKRKKKETAPAPPVVPVPPVSDPMPVDPARRWFERVGRLVTHIGKHDPALQSVNNYTHGSPLELFSTTRKELYSSLTLYLRKVSDWNAAMKCVIESIQRSKSGGKSALFFPLPILLLLLYNGYILGADEVSLLPLVFIINQGLETYNSLKEILPTNVEYAKAYLATPQSALPPSLVSILSSYPPPIDLKSLQNESEVKLVDHASGDETASGSEDSDTDGVEEDPQPKRSSTRSRYRAQKGYSSRTKSRKQSVSGKTEEIDVSNADSKPNELKREFDLQFVPKLGPFPFTLDLVADAPDETPETADLNPTISQPARSMRSRAQSQIPTQSGSTNSLLVLGTLAVDVDQFNSQQIPKRPSIEKAKKILEIPNQIYSMSSLDSLRLEVDIYNEWIRLYNNLYEAPVVDGMGVQYLIAASRAVWFDISEELARLYAVITPVCVCRRTIDANGDMLHCDDCGSLFHRVCIEGIGVQARTSVRTVDQQYTCPGCMVRSSLQSIMADASPLVLTMLTNGASNGNIPGPNVVPIADETSFDAPGTRRSKLLEAATSVYTEEEMIWLSSVAKILHPADHTATLQLRQENYLRTLVKRGRAFINPKLDILTMLKALRAVLWTQVCLKAVTGEEKVSLEDWKVLYASASNISLASPSSPLMRYLRSVKERGEAWFAEMSSILATVGGLSDLTPLQNLYYTASTIPIDAYSTVLRISAILEDGGRPWCLCQGLTSGFMVSCEICENWFHDVCVGITEEDTKAAGGERRATFSFTCPSCSYNTQSSYPYSEQMFENFSRGLVKWHEYSVDQGTLSFLRNERKEKEKGKQKERDKDRSYVSLRLGDVSKVPAGVPSESSQADMSYHPAESMYHHHDEAANMNHQMRKYPPGAMQHSDAPSNGRFVSSAYPATTSVNAVHSAHATSARMPQARPSERRTTKSTRGKGSRQRSQTAAVRARNQEALEAIRMSQVMDAIPPHLLPQLHQLLAPGHPLFNLTNSNPALLAALANAPGGQNALAALIANTIAANNPNALNVLSNPAVLAQLLRNRTENADAQSPNTSQLGTSPQAATDSNASADITPSGQDGIQKRPVKRTRNTRSSPVESPPPEVITTQVRTVLETSTVQEDNIIASPIATEEDYLSSPPVDDLALDLGQKRIRLDDASTNS